MDDYSITSLIESKNEWCARLVSILTHCLVDGIKSIFEEAVKLCVDNEEENKYLMTFQNLLSQIPQWNAVTIELERKRIENVSGCKYLEDLITCVHIIQLKALTCIRVGQKQKKIDIDVPSIDKFIHQIYICSARKLYTNIYLFERDVFPLQAQKNNRELEVLIKEAILTTIRDNIPVEQILRAYMDESEEQEELLNKLDKNIADKKDANSEVKLDEKLKDLSKNLDDKKKEATEANIENVENEANIETVETVETAESKDDLEISVDTNNILTDKNEYSLNFSDIDDVFDSTGTENKVSAPKDLETLDKISAINNERRAREDAEENDSDENIKLNIGDDINLSMDTINLDLPLELKDDPILDDIEHL